MTNEVVLLLHLFFVTSITLIGVKAGKTSLQLLSVLFLLVSNLFISKEIGVFGLTITCCDVYTIGSILCLNMIQEIYGKHEAKKTLYFSISILIVFLILSQFQLWYKETPYSLEEADAFRIILSSVPRIVISSLLVTFTSDTVDRFLFQYIKNKYPTLSFTHRFIGSTVISQFLDTILFTFLALYGSVEKIWDIILVAYLVKVTFILFQGSILSNKFISKKIYSSIGSY